MQLGDLIAQLEDETVADEALIRLGDLSLLTRVAAAAAREAMSRGEFVASCVGQFAARASDEQWMTLVGRMARADDPGRVFVRHAIEAALAQQDPASEQRITHASARPHAL
jgi:hypothetical protein